MVEQQTRNARSRRVATDGFALDRNFRELKLQTGRAHGPPRLFGDCAAADKWRNLQRETTAIARLVQNVVENIPGANRVQQRRAPATTAGDEMERTSKSRPFQKRSCEKTL